MGKKSDFPSFHNRIMGTAGKPASHLGAKPLALVVMMAAKEHVFKVGLLGDGNVGKSSLIRRFVDNAFEAGYKATLGADFMRKTARIGEVEVIFQIWDVAGQRNFQFMQDIIYKGLQGVLYVYDLKAPRSLFSLKSWMRRNQMLNPNYPQCVEIVVGNKLDLYRGREPDVTQETLDRFHTQVRGAHVAKYVYASALTGEGVVQSFEDLGQSLVERTRKEQP